LELFLLKGKVLIAKSKTLKIRKNFRLQFGKLLGQDGIGHFKCW